MHITPSAAGIRCRGLLYYDGEFMNKFELSEASQRMTEAINEMRMVADLLSDDSECFSSTIKDINEQIVDMTRAVKLINAELREVI